MNFRADLPQTPFLVTFTSMDGGRADDAGVLIFDEPIKQTLYSDQSISYRYQLVMSSEKSVTASMNWTEDGKGKSRIMVVNTY